MANELNFGEVQITPRPIPVQWATRQVVVQKTVTDEDGEQHTEDTFLTMLQLFSAAGVNVTFWEGGDLASLGHELLRLDKLNKRRQFDRDPAASAAGG